MICSHSKQFVFIKTMRTAGTSVELSIAPHLANTDILTSGSLVHYRGYARREHTKPIPTGLTAIDLINVLAYGIIDIKRGYKARWKRPFMLRQHASAREVKKLLGAEKWQNYFTFCIERNPWDRMVSFYEYRKLAHDLRLSFEEWVCIALEGSYLDRVKWAAEGVRNYPLYCWKGRPIVDAVYRFEDLHYIYPKIVNKLGLGEGTELNRVNASGRLEPGYRQYYTERLKNLISRELAPEVQIGSYEF